MTEETDRPLDLGSVTDVRKANREIKRAAVTSEVAVRAMLATPAARAFFWTFVESCGIFTQDFHSDSGAMYFMSGQRNAGLRLWALIPEDLKAQMAQEQKEKANA